MTKKQKRFVEEYLIDLNATQAAIRAGYKAGNAQRASEIGSELLQKTPVQEAIAQAMAERSRRTGINQDRVLRELARVAFANASDVINMEDATLRADACVDDTAAIQSVKVKTFGEDGVEREIKMGDKLRALELIGKHLGMFKDNMNLTVETSRKLDDIISQIGGEGLEE